MLYCLIIEDQIVTREILTEYSNMAGFESKAVGDVISAIDECKDRMPDFIVLDWHMPEMDGLDFMRELKSIKSDKKPFVIMCTCDDLVGQKEKLRKAGIDNYMIKPIRFEDFKKAVESLFVAA